MKHVKDDVLQITEAKYSGEYKIKLLFNDDTEKTIDFEDFIKNSKNPMTRKYINKEKFKSFKTEYGDLVWGDYEMCFPIWDLHQGRI